MFSVETQIFSVGTLGFAISQSVEARCGSKVVGTPDVCLCGIFSQSCWHSYFALEVISS